MNILLTPYNYFPNAAAGGEHYLHRLAKGLQSLGHVVKAITNTDHLIIYEGIECYPQGDMRTIWNSNNDLFEWCDTVFHQLIGNSYGYNKCIQHNKENVFFAHNTAKMYFTTDKSRVVYNSNWMASLGLFDRPHTVLQPLVYEQPQVALGTKIALINCNKNKGGDFFIELARSLPDYYFIGIKGMYGEQITADLPNLQYIENGTIPWHEIKALVVPSEVESWSQVATEAISYGIPVVCSDLPGLKENLSYSGLYCDRNNIPLYADKISMLMERDAFYLKQSGLSLRRFKELDPIPRLDKFNKWLQHST